MTKCALHTVFTSGVICKPLFICKSWNSLFAWDGPSKRVVTKSVLLKISTISLFQKKWLKYPQENASSSRLVIVNIKTMDVKIFIPQKDVFYQLAQTEIVQRDTKSCVDTKKVVNFQRISAVNTYTKQWSIVIMRMIIIYQKIKLNN